MNKKFIIGALILIVILIVVFASSGLFSSPSTTGNAVKVVSNEDATEKIPVKEFTMTAFYDDKGIWYSLKEITVDKGDLVRIKITNTKGMHDFKIDELSVFYELPLNQETVVEFVADKAGEFVYYCSKPNHRQRGQWGTLKVLE